jgi:hypothetical protein
MANPREAESAIAANKPDLNGILMSLLPQRIDRA